MSKEPSRFRILWTHQAAWPRFGICQHPFCSLWKHLSRWMEARTMQAAFHSKYIKWVSKLALYFSWVQTKLVGERTPPGVLHYYSFLLCVFSGRSSEKCSFLCSWIWCQASHSPSPPPRLLHRAYLTPRRPRPRPWLPSPKAPLSSPPPACTRWAPSAGGTQTNTTCPFLQVATPVSALCQVTTCNSCWSASF